MSGTLLSIGHGYSARALAARLRAEGWRIIGTTRDPGKAGTLAGEGIEPLIWSAPSGGDPGTGAAELGAALGEADHVLVSAGPDEEGDPVLRSVAGPLARRAAQLGWLGYLSTTGVYGDHGGGWVDEDTPPGPATRRGALRVAAERQWRDMQDRHGLPLHVFRLAGIYGPGRGPFAKLRSGSARRIIKPGQVFSRIHVDDIAQALAASMAAPAPGAIYNLCDDDPAPPQDVIAHAAELLGLPLPPEVPFETAELSPMARSFYAESKRVSNARIKRDLGLRLLFPDYRSGLADLLERERPAEG
ncbi:SDR family oxidoreductase [Profundibacterium mesophilum]|uniref:UDP-glucose 4-epimerase n=1 Tax=Profundibacterium mesophilum KAUST100406-0324 TaxID=1037889 RepID=A0A921NR01_9RHOB|nr:SDR family oxidoreductase [Profundibacterium mesophilum]KAF0675935.1 UDP-glucose 4-epimerase [Profundibacterium mesophilum KAUST100406-0324]